ncbi:MAG: hypothetical protein K0Q93_2969 [Nocardioidaceae bacterium]|nr:hypothetical protein [Nocardioidaceae bacterium]
MPPHRGEHEHLSGSEQRDPAGRGRDCHPQRGQRGGVVEQALPGQDRHEPSGKAQLAADSGGRDGVGWRDDRAEGETCSQGEARDQRPRGEANRGRGGEHKPDRQQRDRPHVVAKAAHRARPGRVVQQRRKEEEQHHLGIELIVRHSRYLRHRERDDHQHDGRRDPGAFGQPRHQDRDDEQGEHRRDVRQHQVHDCLRTPLPRLDQAADETERRARACPATGPWSTARGRACRHADSARGSGGSAQRRHTAVSHLSRLP